ncbi:SRPBCC family protein [Bradyrhizobium guangzhouense]|uniref:ATPase n=1 Tax=Bradyrhizobium guangzhouense TaxID=1325095 RepID=A0AAE5X0M3_9BRAD|nr:SRPBCC family protein [Bradyrhizobium guangzhouense]QAU46549.1 ATPase [Bradyrhizobium guangzhouense]RXH06057.1 ATPase [Bradyrhizobium guangzhouense]RXH08128.1 ATPase [Bradyrhizobium guangzhouense]
MTNAANAALSQWSMDRETVMSRVIDAPRDLVFEAWSDPKHLPQWFGPKGFKIETFEIDVRVGGVWRFNMIGPDGTVYPNRMRFRRIERPKLMEMDHGVDQDEDPNMFRFTIIFAEQADGKTVLMMRQLFANTEQRDQTIGFGAVEYGYQTLDKLAAYVGGLKR